MKICARCGMKLKDEETFCSRCGGQNFKTPEPKQKPQQNNANQASNGNQQNMNMSMPQNNGMNPGMMNPNMQMNGMQGMNMQMQGMQGMNGMNGMQGMNMGMQNMQGMNMQMNGMNMGMPQQQSGGLKSLFKSPKQKKAEMEAEMAMMRQMQQQKAQQQPQQNNQAVKPGQKNSNLFQNNQFSDVQPDMNTQEWLQTLLILLIPIANIFYIIKGMNNPMYPPYRQNFLKAFGIYYGAAMLISIIVSIIITVSTL